MKCKKYIVLSLAVLAVVGSLFTVLASNMFFGDMINIAAGFTNSTLFVSLPAIAVAMTFAIAILFLLRAYKHQDCVKRIARLYSIIIIALNGVGVLGCILSAVVVYGNFFGSRPFPGYLIIFLLLNLAFIACGVLVLLVWSKKLKEDTGRIKINALYVLKTIGWFLFIVLVLNRLGTLLGAPSYIYLRNLYKTFLFYLLLLGPLGLGILEALYILDILVEKKKLLIAISAVLGCILVFWIYSAIMGMNDSAFISSVSQVMPLERMASKPLEMLIQLLSYLGVGAALIVQAFKGKKVEAPAEEPKAE